VFRGRREEGERVDISVLSNTRVFRSGVGVVA
jgi:hypothetical protein